MKRAAPPRLPPRDDHLISLINMIFLLLILFLTSSRLAPGEPFAVRPPQIRHAASAPPAPPRILLLDATGQMALDGRLITAEALGAAVAAPRNTADLLRVKADARLSAGQLRATLEALHAAGVARVELIVVAESRRD